MSEFARKPDLFSHYQRHYTKGAKTYSKRMRNEYHRDRLRMVNKLLEGIQLNNAKVFDFGCGDDPFALQLIGKGAQVSGIDISEEMILLARKKATKAKISPNIFTSGDVTTMRNLKSESLDLIISLNVLAFLTDDEEKLFYHETYRVLKPWGAFVVTHSNELFDLFTMNKYTVSFFDKYFLNADYKEKNSGLLTNPKAPESHVCFNIRENPLCYGYKLAKYGFKEIQQEFSNLHVALPLLLPQDKDYPDTLCWRESERWKLFFLCSTYGSKSIRV